MKIKKREVNKAIKEINKKFNTSIVIKDIDGVSATIKGVVPIHFDCGIMATELNASRVYDAVICGIKEELRVLNHLLSE